MDVANACYHSLLGNNNFISGFKPFALVLRVTNTGARDHGYEAKAETPRTDDVCGSCTVYSRQDV